MKKINKHFIGERILSYTNNLKLRKKFIVLYLFCVIIPLLVTDFIIIISVYSREKVDLQYDMEMVANLYKTYIITDVESDITLARSVENNERINTFLNSAYTEPYDYYKEYYSIVKGSLLETQVGLSTDHLYVYANNDYVLDGKYFRKLSTVQNAQWFKTFEESEGDSRLIVYFDDSSIGKNIQERRKILYVHQMSHYKKGVKKIVVIDNDTNEWSRTLKGMNSKYPCYIFCGDYIMFNNVDDDAVYRDQIIKFNSHPFTETIEVAGCELEVIMYNNNSIIFSVLYDYWWIFIILFLFTLVTPYYVLRVFERSIIGRIQVLEKAFGDDEAQTFQKIDDISGDDELSGLMRKYNQMVDLNDDLTTTLYRNRLKEQEADMAKKNAELLALQSQINPHFLFNALESIRMHSLLKGEEETATMVAKLAFMQRQNVEWGRDFVTIKSEMESIEAYLYLQSYRFGERLNFSVEADEDCENFLIPKLTALTFVENACVHGIESKSTPGYIFVRVYQKDGYAVLEVEDTGGGMEQHEVDELLNNIRNVSIDSIKSRKHIGVLNACLRIKMTSDNLAIFDIDSEPMVGMTFVIKVPLNKLERA